MARAECTYFKATRPNGTDFYSGTVQYTVGKRVRPKPHDGPREICGPGLLHAADVPAETLVGGSWPCRLFVVTGRPVVGFEAEHSHKGGFRQLMVTRELDAHLALGPNGREVAALIERAQRLTDDECHALYVAWGSRLARRAPPLGPPLGAATRAAAGDAARDATRRAAWRAAAGGRRFWTAIGTAAGDAAIALVVRDLISPEHFDALYGLWAEAVSA